MVAFYCKFNRVSSAYAIEHSSAPVYIVAMLKMYYNDPAPYMDRTYIKGYECDQNTFQNPSLEVTISA